MSLLYDSSKLYFVKVGVVTKIEHEGIYTKGATHYDIAPQIYIAQLTKTNYREKIFKLISSNITLSNNHQTTQARGDMFICNAIPFNLKTKNTKHFLSKKGLINLEKSLNDKQSIAKNDGKLNLSDL